jgi:hypothetical protein
MYALMGQYSTAETLSWPQSLSPQPGPLHSHGLKFILSFILSHILCFF